MSLQNITTPNTQYNLYGNSIDILFCSADTADIKSLGAGDIFPDNLYTKNADNTFTRLNQPNQGTSGQVLRSNGDGTVEWANEGGIDTNWYPPIYVSLTNGSSFNSDNWYFTKTDKVITISGTYSLFCFTSSHTIRFRLPFSYNFTPNSYDNLVCVGQGLSMPYLAVGTSKAFMVNNCIRDQTVDPNDITINWRTTDNLGSFPATYPYRFSFNIIIKI